MDREKKASINFQKLTNMRVHEVIEFSGTPPWTTIRVTRVLVGFIYEFDNGTVCTQPLFVPDSTPNGCLS